MGMNRNSVAQLISRARIALRDALRQTALRTIPPASKACEQALPLIAMRADGQLKRTDDAGWLDAHLATCKRCELGREAMAEAGASYRIWAPVAAFEALRRETIAEAGTRLGHDWSEVAASPRTPDASAPSEPSGQPDAGAPTAQSGQPDTGAPTANSASRTRRAIRAAGRGAGRRGRATSPRPQRGADGGPPRDAATVARLGARPAAFAAGTRSVAPARPARPRVRARERGATAS